MEEAGVKSPVAEGLILSSFQLWPLTSLPATRSWDRSPAQEGLLTQPGGWELGGEVHAQEGLLQMSNCATVLVRVQCLSTWRGSFSVSFHALCPLLLLLRVILEHLPESVLHRG